MKIELIIHNSQDEEFIEKISKIKDLDVSRQRRLREIDAPTVLAIAGGVITLINSLIELAKILRQKDDKIIVIVNTEERAKLDLNSASEEDIINFIEKQDTEKED